MKLLHKIYNFIWTENRIYYSENPAHEILQNITRLNNLYDNFGYNTELLGEIINNNQFILYSKWQFLVIRYFENKSVTIKCKIKVEENKTYILTKIRPNSIFLLIILFIFYLGIDWLFEQNNLNNYKNIIFTLFLTILLTTSVILIINFIKSSIRQDFEKLFKLTEIN